MCIYIYVYIYTHMCIHVHMTHIYIYMYMHMYVYIYIYIYICMYTHILFEIPQGCDLQLCNLPRRLSAAGGPAQHIALSS